jgi:hypothetical protein
MLHAGRLISRNATALKCRRKSQSLIRIEDGGSRFHLLVRIHGPAGVAEKVVRPPGWTEDPMREYSLAELLDHPGLGLIMTSGGIERRCLELMLDARSCDRRHTEAEIDRLAVDRRAPE